MRYASSLIIILLALPGVSFAAPAITNVSGTLTHGSAVTITGSGFGMIGPNIRIFDDFEKGINESPISIAAGSAAVNHWDAISDVQMPKYSNAYSLSGGFSLRSDWSDNGEGEGGRYVEINSLNQASDIYFSWWQYLPIDRVVPGTSGGNGPNWKIYWIYGSPWPNDDFVSVLLTDSLPVTDWQSGYFLTGMADDWQDGRIDINSNQGSTVTSFAKGIWHRYEVYLTAGLTDGTLTMWEVDANQNRRQLGTNTGKTADTAWDVLHFPGYGRGDANSQTYYDDIYVATGLGSRARVEIGNASTYDASSNLALVTPTSWSDTSIQADVRLGSFTTGTAYLYVVDATGAVNETGYPVTVGGTPDTTPPAAPTGLGAQ